MRTTETMDDFLVRLIDLYQHRTEKIIREKTVETDIENLEKYYSDFADPSCEFLVFDEPEIGKVVVLNKLFDEYEEIGLISVNIYKYLNDISSRWE